MLTMDSLVFQKIKQKDSNNKNILLIINQKYTFLNLVFYVKVDHVDLCEIQVSCILCLVFYVKKGTIILLRDFVIIITNIFVHLVNKCTYYVKYILQIFRFICLHKK